MFQLYDMQQQLYTQCFEAWQDPTARNLMLVLPTGGGKTVLFCCIAANYGAPVCAIAHRQELVSQIALAFNSQEIPHGIIAPRSVIQQVIRLQMDVHGRSWYQPRAQIRIAGVDTLPNQDHKDRWYSNVQLVVQDEGHHVLAKNKWGKAMALFPNARGLFVTAHAVRADGAGLGRNADGLVDRLILGPCARHLIGRGYLTDYQLACPEDDVDLSDVPVGDTGDFVQARLRDAVHKSKQLVGSVVAEYLKFAAGKLGVTFAVDIQEAEKIQKAYRAAGVPAEIIQAKTPVHVRAQLMRRFRARELLQLVSVDVLGEGVDVPAIEVVSMARHTASWQLMCQQFGRALRVMVGDEHKQRWHAYTDQQRLDLIACSNKPNAILIDHVGNIARHYVHRGLPDMPQTYSLNRAEKRGRKAKDDAIPLTSCLNPICLHPYERVLAKCPRCGTPKPLPAGRGTIEEVDGIVHLLDPRMLAALRGEIAKVDAPVQTFGNDVVARSIRKRHGERQDAQSALRSAMALWAGYQRHVGRSDEESYARFFYRFGVDAATAQTLGQADAIMLQAQILDELYKLNVRAA